jgi:hypothetical protein
MKTYKFKCPHCGGTYANLYSYELQQSSLDAVIDFGNNGLSAEYIETDYVDGAEPISPEEIKSPYYASFMCCDCDEGHWPSIQAMMDAGALVLEQED